MGRMPRLASALRSRSNRRRSRSESTVRCSSCDRHTLGESAAFGQKDGGHATLPHRPDQREVADAASFRKQAGQLRHPALRGALADAPRADRASAPGHATAGRRASLAGAASGQCWSTRPCVRAPGSSMAASNSCRRLRGALLTSTAPQSATAHASSHLPLGLDEGFGELQIAQRWCVG